MFRELLCGDPETVIRLAPRCLIPAFVAGYLCAMYNLPGLITAFQLGSLTLSALSLGEYRTERGLWMLAVFFGVVWTLISVGCAYAEFRDWQRGVANPAAIGVDVALGSIVLKLHTRFLWNTARHNRGLTRCEP